MTERLSELNESQLRYFLFRIKEVANAADESALAEADKMLHEYRELIVITFSEDFGEEIHDEKWELENAKNELLGFEEKIADIKTRINQNVKLSSWEFQGLPEDAESLGVYWPKEFSAAHAEDISRLRVEGQRLAGLGEFTAYSQVVEEMLEAPFYNVSSVQSIVRQLKESAAYFERSKLLTEELKAKIGKGKARAAWYRAKKKLGEAEVAEAGGSSSRSTKFSAPPSNYKNIEKPHMAHDACATKLASSPAKSNIRSLLFIGVSS